jgi:hypothetical protein
MDAPGVTAYFTFLTVGLVVGEAPIAGYENPVYLPARESA